MSGFGARCCCPRSTPSRASLRAALAAAVLRETLAAGGAACRPLVARRGLGTAFIEPALTTLAARGAAPRFAARLQAIEWSGERAAALDFGDEKIALGENDSVALAVPPWAAQDLAARSRRAG